MKNIIKKIVGLTNRASWILLISIVVFSILITVLAIFTQSWRNYWEFLKNEFIQILFLLLISLVIFNISYRRVMRKKVTKLLYVLFTICALFLISAAGLLIPGLEIVFKNTLYSSSNYLAVFCFSFIALVMLGLYDIPFFSSWKELLLDLKDNMQKHVGVLLFIFFLVAFAGILNGIWTYIISALLFLMYLYLFKALLANLRK